MQVDEKFKSIQSRKLFLSLSTSAVSIQTTSSVATGPSTFSVFNNSNSLHKMLNIQLKRVFPLHDYRVNEQLSSVTETYV